MNDHLKSDESSKYRLSAGYALFEIAFNNSNYHSLITTELNKLQDSKKPHWQMAAGRALEMIAIGDLANEARVNPEKIEQIKARLEELSNAGEDHIEYAAERALEAIEKLEAEVEK